MALYEWPLFILRQVMNDKCLKFLDLFMASIAVQKVQ